MTSCLTLMSLGYGYPLEFILIPTVYLQVVRAFLNLNKITVGRTSKNLKFDDFTKKHSYLTIYSLPKKQGEKLAYS